MLLDENEILARSFDYADKFAGNHIHKTCLQKGYEDGMLEYQEMLKKECKSTQNSRENNLISVFARIIALGIKGIIIFFLLSYALNYYNPKLLFFMQSPLIWVFVFIPCFMGYESLISIFFQNKNKKP